MTEDEPYYKIIWTKERRLKVVEMQWFDEADYRLASERKFEHEIAALAYMKKLASEHDVECDLKDSFPLLDSEHFFDERG